MALSSANDPTWMVVDLSNHDTDGVIEKLNRPELLIVLREAHSVSIIDAAHWEYDVDKLAALSTSNMYSPDSAFKVLIVLPGNKQIHPYADTIAQHSAIKISTRALLQNNHCTSLVFRGPKFIEIKPHDHVRHPRALKFNWLIITGMELQREMFVPVQERPSCFNSILLANRFRRAQAVFVVKDFLTNIQARLNLDPNYRFPEHTIYIRCTSEHYNDWKHETERLMPAHFALAQTNEAVALVSKTVEVAEPDHAHCETNRSDDKIIAFKSAER
jgi:hypothetical protein